MPHPPPRHPAQAPRERGGGPTNLVEDQIGAVFAEYVVVFLLASLVVALAVGSLGLPLYDLYLYSEMLIGLPIP